MHKRNKFLVDDVCPAVNNVHRLNSSKTDATALSRLQAFSSSRHAHVERSGENTDGLSLSYEGCIFHRIVKDFAVMGGDIAVSDA